MAPGLFTPKYCSTMPLDILLCIALQRAGDNGTVLEHKGSKLPFGNSLRSSQGGWLPRSFVAYFNLIISNLIIKRALITRRSEVRVLLPQPKKTPPIRVVFSLVMAGVKSLPQVMRPTGVARWVASLRAASGRGSAGAASAAVEKIEGKRKPDDFFGHRKRDSPKLPKTEKQAHTRHRNRSEVRVLLPQPTMRTEKDIGSENPETTLVSGFCFAFCRYNVFRKV